MAVLIPSIDLMGGKIVQLIRGEKKALEFTDFEIWAQRFASYPTIQLIDLDAAMNQGDNRSAVSFFARRLPCQVGGGIRSLEAAQRLLDLGAKRIIVGSAFFNSNRVNAEFARALSAAVGSDTVLAALDARRGKVAIKGWRETVAISPVEAIKNLEPYVAGFLYTNIDTEGSMQGLPLDTIRRLRLATSKQLIAAGGIASLEEVDALHRLGIDAVVGMALYAGRIPA